jgi:hypothetical protein
MNASLGSPHEIKTNSSYDLIEQYYTVTACVRSLELGHLPHCKMMASEVESKEVAGVFTRGQGPSAQKPCNSHRLRELKQLRAIELRPQTKKTSCQSCNLIIYTSSSKSPIFSDPHRQPFLWRTGGREKQRYYTVTLRPNIHFLADLKRNTTKLHV